MAQPALKSLLVLPILLSVGCAQLPAIEERLETMQFQPNLYVTKAGETIDSIAFRYNMASADLSSLNPGFSNQLKPGSRLNIRSDAPLARGPSLTSSYTAGNRSVLAGAKQAASRVIRGKGGVHVSPTKTTEIVVTEIPVPRSAPTPSPLGIESEQTIVTAGVDAAQKPMIFVAPNSNGPKEEIIPDDLDYDPVQMPGVNAQLNEYVGGWNWPTEGQVARAFSDDSSSGHGVDIAGAPGQKVRAVAAGQVIYSGRNPSSGGGNLVIIRHDDNMMTTYGHTDKLFVSEHDFVQAGDSLATLGANLRNESVLAFEVRRDGKPVDPMEFLVVQ